MLTVQKWNAECTNTLEQKDSFMFTSLALLPQDRYMHCDSIILQCSHYYQQWAKSNITRVLAQTLLTLVLGS